jgi:hypothetical protein
MANLNILDNIVSFDGILDGGAWQASLPLANLQNQEPRKIARSIDAASASTIFLLDFGHVVPISIFGLINHNLSGLATIRFRLSASRDLSSPLIDVTVHVNSTGVVWGALVWGAFRWEGYTPDDQPGGTSTVYKHTSTQSARYIGVNIFDAANGDGHVDVGVFVAGDPFVSAINIALGAGLGLVDPSKQSRAVGGALYTDVRPKWRTFNATLEFLTQAEAFGAIYKMRRQLGISGALLMIIDPSDTGVALAASTIYGRLSRIDDPIVIARNTADYVYSAGIEVEELI